MLFAWFSPQVGKTKLRRDALSMGNTKELDLPLNRCDHTTKRNFWLFSFVTQCHIFERRGFTVENRKHVVVAKEVQTCEGESVDIGRFE